jgi:hypothetical protein
MSEKYLSFLEKTHKENHEKINQKIDLDEVSNFLTSIKPEVENLSDEEPKNDYDAGKITFVGCESKNQQEKIPSKVVEFCNLVISVARRYIKTKLDDDPLKAENWCIAYQKIPFLSPISTNKFEFSETKKSFEFTADVKLILGIASSVSTGYMNIILDKISVGGNSENVSQKDDYVFSSRTIYKEGDVYSLNLDVFTSSFDVSGKIIEIHSNCTSGKYQSYEFKMKYTKILYTVVYSDELYDKLKKTLNKATDEFLNDL